MNRADLLKRIVAHPVMSNVACIRNTTVTVADILSALAGGTDAEQLMEKHPELEPEDILAALLYAGEH